LKRKLGEKGPDNKALPVKAGPWVKGKERRGLKEGGFLFDLPLIPVIPSTFILLIEFNNRRSYLVA